MANTSAAMHQCDLCGKPVDANFRRYTPSQVRAAVAAGLRPTGQPERMLEIAGLSSHEKEAAHAGWLDMVFSEPNDWGMCEACAKRTARFLFKNRLSNVSFALTLVTWLAGIVRVILVCGMENAFGKGASVGMSELAYWGALSGVFAGVWLRTDKAEENEISLLLLPTSFHFILFSGAILLVVGGAVGYVLGGVAGALGKVVGFCVAGLGIAGVALFFYVAISRLRKKYGR